MRAWLDYLPELRLTLQPGWYELPSHVEMSEARRLVELLARGVPGVGAVIECSWAELDELVLGPAALVLVTALEGLTREAIVAKLKAHTVRLGVYQRAGVGHWPEVAWDEIAVKGPLVASLRKSLRAAEHPLSAKGIGELPIELLAGATSEPIELLVLVEQTLDMALRQGREDGALDWDECARRAIGGRLARRLTGVEDGLWDAVLACLASATEGTISVVNHPREVEQLVRLGLAHAHEGDASLVPLARFGGDARVVEVLEQHRPAEHATGSATQVQTRATTPDEAFVSFDPRTVVQLGDPWFVDVRTLDPEVARVCRAVGLYLQRRDRGFLVEVACEPGSGANVMLRARLRELEADGLVTITVDLPVELDPIEIARSVLQALLHYYQAQPELVVDDLRMNSMEMLTQIWRQLAARGQRLCLYAPNAGNTEYLASIAEVASDIHLLVSCPPSSACGLRAPNIVHLQYPTEQSPNVLHSILSARAELDAVFEDPERAIDRLFKLSDGNFGRALAIAHLACAWTNDSRVSVADLEEAWSRGLLDLELLR